MLEDTKNFPSSMVIKFVTGASYNFGRIFNGIEDSVLKIANDPDEYPAMKNSFK